MKALASYVEPSENEIQQVLARAEYDYRNARAFLPEDWDTRANFDRQIGTLDRTSSPGWPYMRQATTIGQWLYKGGLLPDQGRLEELWVDVQRVLRGEYRHVWRVFLKMEPHTKAKAQQERWRMIIQCSLAVQVAVKMAVGHLEQRALETMGLHPSTYGEVWFGGGWRRFRMRMERLRLSWCVDKSAWDWNSPGWVFDAIKQLRVRLTVNPTVEWQRFMDWAYSDAYEHSHVMLGDSIYQQCTRGLMKSGSVWTISDNSYAQVLLDRAACYRLGRSYGPIFATGDDTVQRSQDDAYLIEIQRLGCVVKEVVEDYEFMGNRFLEDGPRPMYGGKHIVNVTRVADDDLPTTLDAYMRIYAASPAFRKFFRRLAVKLGVPVRSDAYYRWFLDSPEALERGVFALRSYHNTPDRQGMGGAIV